MMKAMLLAGLVLYLLLAGAFITLVGASYPDENLKSSYGNYWVVSDLLTGLDILPTLAIVIMITIPIALIALLIYDIAIP